MKKLIQVFNSDNEEIGLYITEINIDIVKEVESAFKEGEKNSNDDIQNNADMILESMGIFRIYIDEIVYVK